MANDNLDGVSLLGALCIFIACLLTSLAFGLWFGLGGVAFVAAVIFLLLGVSLP